MKPVLATDAPTTMSVKPISSQGSEPLKFVTTIATPVPVTRADPLQYHAQTFMYPTPPHANHPTPRRVDETGGYVPVPTSEPAEPAFFANSLRSHATR